MLVSIILPMYNAEKYITNCLESFERQKSNEIELVVVNDGSIDKSVDICLLYQKQDTRIKIVNQQNSGVSTARNTGIKYAVGKYIYFLDSDDQLSDEFCKVILQSIETDYDIYFFNYWMQKLEGTIIHTRDDIGDVINNNKLLDSIFFTNSNNEVWCNLYKREVIISNNVVFEDGMKMGEDLLFNLAYVRNIHSAVYIAKPIYIYNSINENSAMHVSRIEYINDYIHIYKYVMDNYGNCGYNSGLLDIETYLNAIFRTLLNSKYHKNESTVKDFKNSPLFIDLINYKFQRLIPNLKKRFLRFHLYRNKLLMNAIRWTIYKGK